MMLNPTYPAIPLFSFVGFALVLIPLPWHLEAWNSGTCLYMVWTALALLNQAVNSIVWRDNAINWAPIWCDISSRLVVGVAVAIPAASLCINRRLYKIATIRTVSISKVDKRRAVLVDLLIGLGLPVLQMVLQFVVEGHRFNIFEDIGCYPSTYNSPPAFALSYVWPTAIGLVSAVYCILTLRAFMQRRAQFSEFLSSTTSLTINRYFRLMALATTELLCTVPISAYGIYLNAVKAPIYPWKGFADAHYNYSRVELVPAVIWRMDNITVVSFALSQWSLIFCGLVFFTFFGFADEARKQYRKVYRSILKRLGVSHADSSSGLRAPKLSLGSLPVYVPRSGRPKSEKDTLSSICDSPSLEDFKEDIQSKV
ncbi:STE3-domain-containing protein [Paxillus ammoniavirescens]|nr:STE3-domain-containing protein [Paxillus ammoniavirescens]